jgi:hypothetical protein
MTEQQAPDRGCRAVCGNKEAAGDGAWTLRAGQGCTESSASQLNAAQLGLCEAGPTARKFEEPGVEAGAVYVPVVATIGLLAARFEVEGMNELGFWPDACTFGHGLGQKSQGPLGVVSQQTAATAAAARVGAVDEQSADACGQVRGAGAAGSAGADNQNIIAVGYGLSRWTRGVQARCVAIHCCDATGGRMLRGLFTAAATDV